MSNNNCISLLSNIKIDDQEKFNLLKITIVDASQIFDEAHIKIRGVLAKEVVEFINNIGFKRLYLYQELQESDWVDATLMMLNQVRTRSLFLYFEDHKLVGSKSLLEKTIADFESYNLDYLSYSFFKASKLGVENILPLDVIQGEQFDNFSLSTQNIDLVGKISPTYYTFSLVSLCSVDYFRELLSMEKKSFKIYSKLLNVLITRLFPYPKHRSVFYMINKTITSLGVRMCLYPPSSPFNIEKIWFETPFLKKRNWKFGIPKQELFANYDDDNGAYGESLIKKGLYPFVNEIIFSPENKAVSDKFIKRTVELLQGQCFNLLYYSTVGRISKPPIVFIKVTTGVILLKMSDHELVMGPGDSRGIYSNKAAVLEANEAAVLELQVFDEAF
jgi:hypothetical protein